MRKHLILLVIMSFGYQLTCAQVLKLEHRRLNMTVLTKGKVHKAADEFRVLLEECGAKNITYETGNGAYGSKYVHVEADVNTICYDTARAYLFTYDYDPRTIDENRNLQEYDTTHYSRDLAILESRERSIQKAFDSIFVGHPLYKSTEYELIQIQKNIKRKKSSLADFEKRYTEQHRLQVSFHDRSLKEVQKEEKRRDRDFMWSDYFMPGLSYSYLQPSLDYGYGHFHGINVQLVTYSQFKSDASGPSYLKTYIKFINYRSLEQNDARLFKYSAGLLTSLENKLTRRWLIPYIGLEIGGLSSEHIGSSLGFFPSVGVLPFVSKKWQMHVQASYTYAIRHTNQFEAFLFDAGFNFILWD